MFGSLSGKELHYLAKVLADASERVYYQALFAVECGAPEADGLRATHTEIAYVHADVAGELLDRARLTPAGAA